MASCITQQWVSYAPQARLTVTQQSETEAQAVLAWKLEYVAHGYAASTNNTARAYTVTINGSVPDGGSGSFNIHGIKDTRTVASGTVVINKTTAAQSISFSVSFTFNLTWSGSYKNSLSASGSISVAKKTSYTVSYNANGGSGAPSSQTKWHGTTLKLSSNAPTRTGYSFQGWATTSGGGVSYAAGANYTANAAATLYAVWKANTYTVSYNANGGSGAPSNQTKTYGQDLTLSSTKPTRQNYNFLGWATSSAASAVDYASGAKYKQNAAVTLYAVWELAYTRPRIGNVYLIRRDSTTGDISDEGNEVWLDFQWECDQAVSSIEVAWESETGNSGSDILSGSGTSGLAFKIFTDVFSLDSTYTVTVTVRDGGGYTTAVTTLAGTKYPLDLKAGGDGIAFGKPAELPNVADIGFQTRFYGGILHLTLEPETDLNDVLTPNTYIGANVASYAYLNCPISSGTFTLTVEGAGGEGQVKQILTRCSKYDAERYIRFYYQSAWGEWVSDVAATIYVQDAGTDLNNYKTSGVYYFNSSNTPLNLPTTDSAVNPWNPVNGWLIVLRADAGAIKQFFCRYGSFADNDHQVWVRTGNGSVWGNWSGIANRPVMLYRNDSGSGGTITLSETAANFDYLEIIFADNNSKLGGYAKVANPNGKTITLSISEAHENNTYIRRTNYTLSGTSLAPISTAQGYFRSTGTAVSTTTDSNYLRIRQVLGYRA